MNTAYLAQGREIHGYLDENIGEFQSILSEHSTTQSNMFNQEKQKIGRKYKYLMIDGERVDPDTNISKKTKILISVQPGDKAKEE
jgi:hypothetical protein